MRKKIRRGRAWKFILLVVLIGGVTALISSGILDEYVNREKLHMLFSAIAAEPWAPVLFVTVFFLGVGVGAPASVLTLVGGVVFGVWPGALLNWLGTTIGAGLAFLVARYLGRDFIRGLLGERFQRLDAAVSNNGFSAIFVMRLIPIVPFNLSNFAVGLTGVRFWTYILATGLAIFPGLTIVTYFAHSLWSGTGDGRAFGHVIVASLLMLVLIALPRIYQRYLSRDASSDSV